MNETNTTTGVSSLRGFPPMLILFITLQQTVFVVACLGNGIVIFVFWKYLKFKANTNKFIVSLAVADFFTGVSSGGQIFYFRFPSISSNMAICILRYQVISFLTIVSQLTVGLTTLDRYIAICHPHQYSKVITRTTSNIMCIIPWTLSIYELLPFAGLNNWYPGRECAHSLLFPKAFYGLKSILIYVVSIMTFTTYLIIFRTAWRHRRRIKPHQSQQENQAKLKAMEKDIRSAIVTGMVTVVFSLCWLPWNGIRLRDLVMSRRSKTLDDIGNWLVFLGIFNSIVNPFIYAWKRPDFNRQCRKIICCSNTGGTE